MSSATASASTRREPKGIARLIGTAKKKGVGTDRVYGAVVPYIVTTAPNWAGTIGRFTLTIDKGQPETPSACAGRG